MIHSRNTLLESAEMNGPSTCEWNPPVWLCVLHASCVCHIKASIKPTFYSPAISACLHSVVACSTAQLCCLAVLYRLWKPPHCFLVHIEVGGEGEGQEEATQDSNKEGHCEW